MKTCGDAEKELEREKSTRRAMQDKHRALEDGELQNGESGNTTIV